MFKFDKKTRIKHKPYKIIKYCVIKSAELEILRNELSIQLNKFAKHLLLDVFFTLKPKEVELP